MITSTKNYTKKKKKRTDRTLGQMVKERKKRATKLKNKSTNDNKC